MAFPPEAFIIGAQKSGTTSLAEALGSQPGITLSNPKESQYFTVHWDRGEAWYRERFQGPVDTVFLDASPDYSAAPTRSFPREVHRDDPRGLTPQRIHSLNPDARFIYILRDPVARVYSSYWHAVRGGYVNRNFRDVIAKNPAYIRTSDYAGQIRNYLEYFPQDRLMLLNFKAFVEEPESVVRQCCEFLDVPYVSTSGADESREKNKSYQLSPLAKFVRLLTGSNDNFKALSRHIRSVTPEFAERRIKALMTREIPGMEESDREYLKELFRDRNAELHELTGFDISSWQ